MSETSRLIGLDGNSKMGKSLGNAIYLSDSEEVIRQKVNTALTDVNRIRLSDKGNPYSCTVAKYHQVFNTAAYEEICQGCSEAQIGCVACKKRLAEKINELLTPMRERRAYYENHLDEVREMIHSGSKKANEIGNETIAKIKNKMNICID